jgi:hypothetical protein
MAGLWGVAMLVVGLSGCGSSSGKCSTNCGQDSATDEAKKDSGSDHGKETDAGGSRDARDGRIDGASDARDAGEPRDGATSCDHTIAEACAVTPDAGAFSVHCASTFASTATNAYLCGRPQTTVILYTCGADRELIVTNPSGGSDEYVYLYDGSGALYAISYATAGTSHCVAGPKAFFDPVGCTQTGLFSCPKDGG